MSALDVMIIDDEKAICDLCTGYIRKLDCFRNIVIAEDGGLALAKLGKQQFGVVVLDYKLPKMNGLQLLKEYSKVKDNNVERVIMISGQLDKTTIATARQLGVKHFLVKPFGEEELLSKVRTILKEML